MKTNQVLLSVLIVLSLISCNAYKEELKVNGYESEAIHNAILDFSNKSPLFRKDTIFSVNVIKTFDSTKYVIGIIGDDMKILVNDSIRAMIGLKVKTIPTRYLEIENRLFTWWDDDYPLTKQTLEIYKRYNLLQDDEGGWIKFPDFCKNNLTIYKKVTTNIGFGYYEPPVINCK